VRLRERPDAYILTFRGQELLPIMLLFTIGKPLIFDEFIVPLAWAKQENQRLTIRNRFFKFLSVVSAPFYKRWLKRCYRILTDTEAHAVASAGLTGLPLTQYLTIPVGTDETLFNLLPTRRTKPKRSFEVFFYGLKMTPLHGLSYILSAAVQLGDMAPEVQFVIVGGDEATKKAVQIAVAEGAHITYKQFIEFDDLPQAMRDADLCLGGPFGDTPQAHHVVTGKTFQFLACGLPTVIGTNVSTSKFIDGVNSLAVPLGNADALTHKILWAYKHPSALETIGRNGRALYEAEFSSAVVRRLLDQLLSELA
jgi:glycosyltransferase involved in cell wall biosynthesis